MFARVVPLLAPLAVGFVWLVAGNDVSVAGTVQVADSPAATEGESAGASGDAQASPTAESEAAESEAGQSKAAEASVAEEANEGEKSPGEDPPSSGTNSDQASQEGADADNESDPESGDPESGDADDGAEGDGGGSHESDVHEGGDSHPGDGHTAEAHEEANGGEHHDPYDLSHANAGPKLEDPTELRTDLAIWTFVVFLLLLGVLGKFAWRPIMDGLERREQSVAAMLDDAQKSAEKAEQQLKQYEAKLAAAAEEAREMIAQARQDAETAGERIVAEAQEVAERERQCAIDDVAAAKTAAMQEITEQSVDLAVLMAGRLLQRQLTADDRNGLVREALEQLPSRN